ncbi:ABC transporter permease subunit [Alkalihalobacterium alkalinitrilicum]|uniref:ABC transporter permease subunit n=1 Tax=Alkalihalobacterium alkalinitrilicum TaxID=427920 RepID=UPI001C57EFF4|nr:ABC transporter permease subunit [Alkalihalobacterium alkalinitrilicum]
MKEYKQTKTLIWGLLILFFFDFPIRVSLNLESWKTMEEHALIEPTAYANPIVHDFMVRSLFFGGFATFLGMIIIVLLAGIMIGSERNTRKNDFSFALPYKRRDMFLTKWLIGVLSVSVFYTVNYLAAYFLVATSDYKHFLEQFSHVQLLIMPLLGFITLFSFAMLIGTVSGEMVSQMVLTFIFTFFPLGFYYLVSGFWMIHTNEYLHEPTALTYFVWPIYSIDAYSNKPLLIPIVATIIFTIIATKLYTVNKTEHNGEFLIFKGLQPVFKVGILICFALLGGMLISSLTPYTNGNILTIVFYWIGFIVFALLSYRLTTRLLTMNVTVKNK